MLVLIKVGLIGISFVELPITGSLGYFRSGMIYESSFSSQYSSLNGIGPTFYQANAMIEPLQAYCSNNPSN